MLAAIGPLVVEAILDTLPNRRPIRVMHPREEFVEGMRPVVPFEAEQPAPAGVHGDRAPGDAPVPNAFADGTEDMLVVLPAGFGATLAARARRPCRGHATFDGRHQPLQMILDDDLGHAQIAQFARGRFANAIGDGEHGQARRASLDQGQHGTDPWLGVFESGENRVPGPILESQSQCVRMADAAAVGEQPIAAHAVCDLTKVRLAVVDEKQVQHGPGM